MTITRRDIDEHLAGLDAQLAATDAHRRIELYFVESQWFYDTTLQEEDVRHAVEGLAAIKAKYEIDARGFDEDAS